MEGTLDDVPASIERLPLSCLYTEEIPGPILQMV